MCLNQNVKKPRVSVFSGRLKYEVLVKDITHYLSLATVVNWVLSIFGG